MDTNEIRDGLRQAVRDDSTWRDNAAEDFDYYVGKQWGEADARKLDGEKRPRLTINKLKPMADLIIGWWTAERYALRVLPVEGGDEDTAAALTHILRHGMENTDARWKETRVFSDGVICGRGYRMLNLDYSQDPQGDIGIMWLDPLSVVFDPLSTEPNLSDAAFVMRVATMPKERIRFIYGKEALRGLSNYENTTDSALFKLSYKDKEYMNRYKHYMLVECWYKDYPLKWVVVDRSTGEQRDMIDENMARYIAYNANAEGIPAEVRRVRQPRVRMRTVCGSHTLAEGETPFGEGDYPIIPYFASLVAGEHQGVITLGKGPQDEFNKQRSLYLECIEEMVKGGMISEQGALVRPNVIEEWGTVPGVHLEVKRGRPYPAPIPTPSLPHDLVLLNQMAEADIRAVTAVNEDLLGIAGPSEASGRAIFLRQQQGQRALGHILDNFKYSRVQLARNWIRGIQRHVTAQKMYRILGEDGTMYQNVVLDSNVRLGKYDVVVGEQPDSPTQKMINFMMMGDFLRDVGNLPLPLQIALLKASPMVNKPELMQALEANAQALQAAQGPTGQPMPGGAAPPRTGA